ncbi:hypothetical protein ACH492_22780 [Streptomyces sp. NPDC019443]|uniref:hypothetical protein n=1 Tax=Streptomyces sp. NPDC019443 TaxID=3365061 RepID=UPI0037A8FF52
MSRTRHAVVFTLITAATLTLTACGSGDPATAGAGAKPGAKPGKLPTTDVVSAVAKDEAVAKLDSRRAPRWRPPSRRR